MFCYESALNYVNAINKCTLKEKKYKIINAFATTRYDYIC